MSKVFLTTILLLFGTTLFAQSDSTEKPQAEISEVKELQMARDTAKAALKAKTLENKKNNSRFDKMQNDKNKFKTQLSTAKKAKKSDKVEEIQGKIEENKQNIKDLDAQLKAEDKEIAQLEKELKNAEKALKAAKEKVLKEKAKKK